MVKKASGVCDVIVGGLCALVDVFPAQPRTRED